MSAINTLEPITFSHSSLSSYRSCARKLEFRKFYQHGGKRDASLPADAGSAVHEGYQTYLRTGSEDLAFINMMLAYPTEYYGEKDNFWDPTKDRSLEACYSALQAMIASASMMEFSLAEVIDLTGQKRDAVEMEFELKINNFDILGRPVIYQGFIDAIMFNQLTGEYRVIDVKTHRNYRKDLSADYQYHEQCTPYGMVIQHMVSPELMTFEVTYLSVFLDLIEPKVMPYTYTKTLDDMQDWFKSLCFDLKQIKTYAELDWWPRTKNGCVFYNRPCAYLPLCGSRDRESIEGWFLASDDEPYVPAERKPWVVLEIDYPEELK